MKALNNEVTRLTGKRQADAIRERVVDAKSSNRYASAKSRPVGLKEKRLDSSVNVTYLYTAGEQEGGRKRATGSNWSLKFIRVIDLW